MLFMDDVHELFSSEFSTTDYKIIQVLDRLPVRNLYPCMGHVTYCGRMPDLQSREPGLESPFASFKVWAFSFST